MRSTLEGPPGSLGGADGGNKMSRCNGHRAHIFCLLLSTGCQYWGNYCILLMFSSTSEPAAVQSCSGKKQQIDDVVELERLLKARLISSTTHQPDLRQR